MTLKLASNCNHMKPDHSRLKLSSLQAIEVCIKDILHIRAQGQSQNCIVGEGRLPWQLLAGYVILNVGCDVAVDTLCETD